ncbi:77_t:CDS:2 [Cetraspora pellucida]|uniref:77_t:CDS:1 n=1 Tax=Cetraspora pellucida TaxID=1433469 RepID=A0A9N9E2R5_9GLOM|nr:77_t:CDS:2 [Cetraspora pellucida]
MLVGFTPLCLQNLTIPEQILILSEYMYVNIIQLINKKHTHHKLKDHIVTLSQNLGSITKVLPLPTFCLCKYIKVMFISQGKPIDYHLKNLLQVRKSKVIKALHWLFIYNVLFKELEFSKTILNSFLKDKIPKSLLLTTTIVNLNQEEDIKIAIEQERNRLPIKNQTILEVLRNINVAGSKLMASHQSCLSDLHSPIVIMYAGKEIDIDKLLPENFPKATKQAQLAYLDPLAVAKYFNVIIRTTLDTIIEYSKKENNVFEDVSYLLAKNKILIDEMLEAEYKAPKTIQEKCMHPSFLPIPKSNLPDFENKFHLVLLAIVKCILFYCCNKLCMKYNRDLIHDCRFDFFRELVSSPNKSHKLITKYLNKIASQTELTSPQVAAYLLGINDHYTSSTIASYKTILQNKDSDNTKNDLINFINSTESQHNNYTNEIIREPIDLLKKFTSELNEEQKKAYFLVYDYHQKNQKTCFIKSSQLLLFLTSAGGIKIAAANISGYTIHLACGFEFEKHKKNNLSNKQLHYLQEI